MKEKTGTLDGVDNKRHIEQTFTVEPSQSSAEIAEAFGIEAGHEKRVVDVEVPNELPDVTYITGESGCGKTTLMKELGWSQAAQQIDIPDGPLFEWADDTGEALRLLSQVGLSDATLFVSRYEELSDSQQFRARLYKRLLSDDDVLFFDEFLSTLDRMTARPVAYVFQKVCRRLDKKVVVATAHNDLREYLQPSLYIEGKAFPSRWTVDYQPDIEPENPFIDNLEIRDEDKEWYRECHLGELHYKGKYTGGVKDYKACYYDDKLVGFLISTYRMWDGGRRISRLVTHPSYRSCGIGQYIVEDYLEERPEADTVAAMARFNPVFEKAGMTRVEDSEVKPPTGLTTDLKAEGFDKDQWYSKSYCIDFMQDSDNRDLLAEYAEELSYFVSPGGEYLEDDEVQEKIENDAELAGRVLWNVRPKTMAKFVGPGADEADS